MKKKIFLVALFAASALMMVACSNKSYKTYDKELSIVSLLNYSSGEEKATDIKGLTADGKLKLKFIEGEDYIPYIDPFSYFKFIPDGLREKCTYVDTENEVDFVYSAKDAKASVRIFPKEKQVLFENQISYIYEDEDNTSVSLRTKFENKFDKTKMVDQVINYSEYGFNIFREDGKTYFPLAFLEPLVTASHNTTVFYNYDKLYVYREPEALAKYKLLVDGKETTVLDEMKAKAQDVMPEYLRKFNKNCLYYMFDNFYGLRDVKGITKMSTYFESQEYSKSLLSDNAVVRANALDLMISALNDGHTDALYPATAWGEDVDQSLPQSLKKDREALEKALKDERNRVYKSLNLDLDDVRYSADGKTAVITLDEFGVDSFIYKEDKKLKTDAELAESDHFFKLLTNLREIDKKTGVANVVIDMSVNAGGNSGTMVKILNLISSTNKAEITFRDSATNVINTFGSSIDSNNDGKYDDNDVYGKKYKFFILTSPVAFSCGTAMPFYVSHQNLGYIVGHHQGGGECALNQFVLPNGQIMAISSTLHVSTIEEGELIGDEAGVEAEVSYSYFDFYDIEKLNTKIKSFREFMKI